MKTQWQKLEEQKASGNFPAMASEVFRLRAKVIHHTRKRLDLCRCHLHHSRLGLDRTKISLLRYLAAYHQHGNDHRNVPDGVSYPKQRAASYAKAPACQGGQRKAGCVLRFLDDSAASFSAAISETRSDPRLVRQLILRQPVTVTLSNHESLSR